MIYTTRYASPLGDILLAARANALVGLWFDGQRYFAAGLSPAPVRRDDLPLFDDVRAFLDAYFLGKNPSPHRIPTDPTGTPFQKRVWAALRDIPHGQTTTYGAIAARIGAHPRAVGAAVGRNPISIIIPCHRVVGVRGAITGYAGGVNRKEKLLALEQDGFWP
ncbi:methylated-DNA--[protein]-cysteine S-methyltransferase [bacterium]|nr:methylated-DNA--[protein]-cysteine S-methyltransferase [bacterium]